MMYADSHIHLQDYKTQDVKDIVNAAQKNGVTAFINASAHPADWPAVAALADEYSCVVPAFGVHPWHIGAAAPDWAEKLAQYLQKYPKAMVGECGIDRLKNPDVAAQQKFLLPQIKLAAQYKRALIIHAVKADEPMAELFPLLPERTVFHSFTGSAEWGRQIRNRGFFIGLNFSLLRKKNAAELVQSLNPEQILLETDGPYQSGTPGVETLPQNLPLLAAQIAEFLNLPLEKLQNILAQNQRRFIGE